MSINIQDILKVNVVLAGVCLLRDPPQRDAFAASIESDVITQPIAPIPFPGLSMPGFPASLLEGSDFTVNLPRDRIELVSQESQSSVEREYPTTIDDLDRLAEVTNQAIYLTDLTGQLPVAYGFNIQLVYLPTVDERSGEYLAKRLFRQFGLEGWTLTGGSARMSFNLADALYNFVVEPRGQDPTSPKVFLSLNLHKEKQQIPSRDEIEVSLRDIWVRSQQFANQLDTGL